MKTLFTLLAGLAVSFSALASGGEGRVAYAVDISSSEIVWKASKITGKHHGTVSLQSGSLIFENTVLAAGAFTIDMSTIANLDMAGSQGAAKLEGHLRSDDFFSVAKYPTAHFEITRAIPYGTSGDYKIIGNLTIKNITNPIKFMARVTKEGGVTTATAEITVDRSEYDVRYGSGSFFDNLGDKAISDDFILEVQMVLTEV